MRGGEGLSTPSRWGVLLALLLLFLFAGWLRFACLCWCGACCVVAVRLVACCLPAVAVLLLLLPAPPACGGLWALLSLLGGVLVSAVAFCLPAVCVLGLACPGPPALEVDFFYCEGRCKCFSSFMLLAAPLFEAQSSLGPLCPHFLYYHTVYLLCVVNATPKAVGFF